ncbi:MAG: nucleotidyltransferase domain-containing protein [Polyangia bacterium]|jgi:predicted nucleotidyltransferase|nr:nucleotidyltransferase domain-containing protein [Polyangia bacterium]
MKPDSEEPKRKQSRLSVDPGVLADLCRRHRIIRLSLFGSELRGTAQPESDLDLLVEFEPGASISLFDMARIEIELTSILGGRRVDLRTSADLSRFFRDEVLRTAEVQYAAG